MAGAYGFGQVSNPVGNILDNTIKGYGFGQALGHASQDEQLRQEQIDYTRGQQQRENTLGDIEVQNAQKQQEQAAHLQKLADFYAKVKRTPDDQLDGLEQEYNDVLSPLGVPMEVGADSFQPNVEQGAKVLSGQAGINDPATVKAANSMLRNKDGANITGLYPSQGGGVHIETEKDGKVAPLTEKDADGKAVVRDVPAEALMNHVAGVHALNETVRSDPKTTAFANRMAALNDPAAQRKAVLSDIKDQASAAQGKFGDDKKVLKVQFPGKNATKGIAFYDDGTKEVIDLSSGDGATDDVTTIAMYPDGTNHGINGANHKFEDDPPGTQYQSIDSKGAVYRHEPKGSAASKFDYVRNANGTWSIHDKSVQLTQGQTPLGAVPKDKQQGESPEHKALQARLNEQFKADQKQHAVDMTDYNNKVADRDALVRNGWKNSHGVAVKPYDMEPPPKGPNVNDYTAPPERRARSANGGATVDPDTGDVSGPDDQQEEPDTTDDTGDEGDTTDETADEPAAASAAPTAPSPATAPKAAAKPSAAAPASAPAADSAAPDDTADEEPAPAAKPKYVKPPATMTMEDVHVAAMQTVMGRGQIYHLYDHKTGKTKANYQKIMDAAIKEVIARAKAAGTTIVN